MNKNIDDKFLFENMTNIEENILKDLPKENELNHHFSETFKIKMSKYFNKKISKKYFFYFALSSFAIIMICFRLISNNKSLEFSKKIDNKYITLKKDNLNYTLIKSNENSLDILYSKSILTSEDNIPKIENGVYSVIKIKDKEINIITKDNISKAYWLYGTEMYYVVGTSGVDELIEKTKFIIKELKL